MFAKDFTFIITTYRSEKLINECLKDLPTENRKLIIENSGDKNLKETIEKTLIIQNVF